MTTGVFSLPYLTTGGMTTATATRTNETVGYNPTYTVSITISYDLDSTGEIMVYFPDSLVFYNTSAGTITCSIKNLGGATLLTTNCEVLTAVDSKSMGYFLASVVSNMLCGTLTCTSGSSFVFVISGGITNAFNTKTAKGDVLSVGY